MQIIKRIIVVNTDITEMWDFFSKPKNLSKITPKDMMFKIVSGNAEQTYAGQVIVYKVNVLPFIRMQWVTEITQCIKGKMFIDEQRFGPYRFWHHQHLFEDLGSGKTKMTDIVHYKLPLVPFAGLVNRLLVKRQLDKIFNYRTKVVNELFGVEEA